MGSNDLQADHLIALLVLTLAMASTSEAQGQLEEDQTQIPVNLSLTVYVCLNPEKEPPCSCWIEEEKATACPGCQEWRRDTITDDRTLMLDESAYSYASGLPRANFFVQDVSERLYGIDFPTTKAGFPVTTTSLYRNYAELGWSEVPLEADKTGSIAIWRGHAGLVIEDKDGDVKVLYPSDKFDGRLREGEAMSLRLGSTPRFIVPEEFLRDLALESVTLENITEQPPFP